ncbi:coproporphyrinogen oxidase [Synchytrium microbalum]|uniref:coproporphyrinogen oxidase n=1 Tax=Synchytrium microbalum TaxID=1806994 RepID=A0A507CED2_9FUNG|nr:coproporphyrinogen oxidase [Synchytrium microbalum]TPX36284.1 coproporphyrinogen oxidase [Synchytrium microbalum]
MFASQTRISPIVARAFFSIQGTRRSLVNVTPSRVRSGASRFILFSGSLVTGVALGVGMWIQQNSVIFADAKKPQAIASSSDKPPMRKQMELFVKDLQTEIVSAIRDLDSSATYTRDAWTRTEGGEGISCVMQNGTVFEKAGVGVSIVGGTLAEGMEKSMRARKKDDLGPGPFKFFAAGISLVIHPHNPMAPTVHANYRYFELRREEDGPPVSAWFGGGCDLTPSYLFPEDAIHFHQVIKTACDKHNPTYYPRFKKWCDDYFYIPHRGERRGIGGIFFDDLESEGTPDQLFAFVKECGKSFVNQYIPIVKRRIHLPYTDAQKRWQQIRRGRYVEFNLVYDRGTKFGLATPGARIESILMSLPLTARWEYQQAPTPGSEEDKLLDVLKTPKEWL